VKRQSIQFSEFALPVVHAWAERWFLLTAGDYAAGRYNLMTVAWGAFGVMWTKPLAAVVVRPSRYTHRFMEEGADFSLCAFPREFRDKLTLCGTKSGRTTDKVRECGFTPIALDRIAAPGYEQAELIIECRKMYFDDFKPAHFLDPAIEANYNGEDYHRMYFGEILAIHGTEEYRRR